METKTTKTKETLEFISNEDAKNKLIAKGFKWICKGCGTPYKIKPTEFYEDGHKGRLLDMCGCGCDLIEELEKASFLNPKVNIVDGEIILKKHHFKYCKCANGEVWTGDAGTECGMEHILDLIAKEDDKEIFYCLKGNVKIIVLNSTDEELKKPDEKGSTFSRFPRGKGV